MSHELYGRAFQAFHEDESRRSARATIPVVLGHVPAKSVIDVGCGIGTWLAEFAAAGITDYLGIDGPWVERSQLLIDPSQFVACDLAQPWPVDRQFDLASCLEVAEHLPGSSAGHLVESLCRLAPVVLFSAAIPHQLGDGHINLQYPEYWRDHFKTHDYVVVDALRPLVWNDEAICSWYRQNMLLFVNRERIADYPRLAQVHARDGENRPLSFVHPQYFEEIHTSLLDKVRQSQQLAMRLLVRLRTCNVVAFPDWSQGAAAVRPQLCRLFEALLARGDRASITLVIALGGPDLASAHGLLASVADEYLRRAAASTMPEVSAVGSTFGPEQWEVLITCLQARIGLECDDRQAIDLAGTGSLRVISPGELAAGVPLGARAVSGS